MGRSSPAGQGQPAHEPLIPAGGSSALQHRKHLQNPGPSQQGPVRHRHAGVVPLRRICADPGHRLLGRAGVSGPGRGNRWRVRLPCVVLGWCADPVCSVRAGDHAVHHGVDHHADPVGGDPQARGVAGSGCSRPAQDHPVDPVPGHRHRRVASHRPGLRVPFRRRRIRRGQPPWRRGPHPQLRGGQGPVDRAHPHHRHRRADVDGGTHHPAGYRQRHVAADLCFGGLEHAGTVLPGAG